MIILTVIVSWFLADIFTGVIHWWEDQYLLSSSKNKILSSLAKDNELHHVDPGAMGRISIRENISLSISIAWPLTLVLFLLGFPTVVWLTIFFASFGNLVHRYAHVPQNGLHDVVIILQGLGLFVSPEHHGIHHYDENGVIPKEDTTIKFCPMSNYMNPILDFIKFFSALEFIFGVFGMHTIKERNK